ncbi:MAG: hypothetical protein R2712_19360 [Vicinamibacterales bacterium]
MRALQDMTERVNGAACLDVLLDSILAGLEEIFGFRHAMLLVPAEEPGVLVTSPAAECGDTGVGAEARLGEGIVGLVAEADPFASRGCSAPCSTPTRWPRGRSSRAAWPRRRGFRCPARPAPRASWACPSWCAASWSACCASKARPCPLPRGRQGVDRAPRQLPRDCDQNMQLQERAEADVPVAAVGPAAPAPAFSGHGASAGDRLLRGRRAGDGGRRVSIRSLPARIL